MTVEDRLARLERDNARLRRLLFVVPLIALAPALLAYVPANDKIEAGEFIVRDKSGAIRARLYIDDDGHTKLMLRDRNLKSDAVMTAGSGGSLSLNDKDGKPSVVITAGAAPKGLDVQDPWASPD
jgi:hypothetical protein